MITLGEAARLANTSKTTLTRAIRAGRLSATLCEDGSYLLDAREFARVYKVKLDKPAPNRALKQMFGVGDSVAPPPASPAMRQTPVEVEAPPLSPTISAAAPKSIEPHDAPSIVEVISAAPAIEREDLTALGETMSRAEPQPLAQDEAPLANQAASEWTPQAIEAAVAILAGDVAGETAPPAIEHVDVPAIDAAIGAADQDSFEQNVALAASTDLDVPAAQAVMRENFVEPSAALAEEAPQAIGHDVPPTDDQTGEAKAQPVELEAAGASTISISEATRRVIEHDRTSKASGPTGETAAQTIDSDDMPIIGKKIGDLTSQTTEQGETTEVGVPVSPIASKTMERDDPLLSPGQFETTVDGEAKGVEPFAALDVQIGELRELLAEVRANRDELRRDRDHWREQAERVSLALAQPKGRWWTRLTG